MKRVAHSALQRGRGMLLHALTEQDCERVHEASLEILADRGMVFQSEAVRTLLSDHGCETDSEGYTHFPRNLVLDALASTPSEYVFRGRTAEDDIPLCKDQLYGCTSGEALYTYDLDTDERRAVTKQDMVNIIRIVDGLDNMHIYNRLCTPSDVPTESADIHNAEAAFCFTAKPIHLVSKDPWSTKQIIRMAEVVAGGKEQLRKRPSCAFNIMPISPLQAPDHLCDNAFLLAEAGLPMNVISVIQLGGVSPASLGGSLVLTNTEILGLLTMLQCMKKGLPLCYGATPTSMDLRKGLCLFGTPEAFTLNAAAASMARYYSLPSYITGGKNDALDRDIQSGVERSMSRLLTALAGSTSLSGAGLMEGGMVVDIPTLILDDEIMDSILRIVGGVQTDVTSLSVDLIKEIGAFGLYLTHEDTFNRMHDLSDYSIFNRNNNETWTNAGCPSVIENGKKRAKELLATHKQARPLSQGQVSAIRQIVIDAEAERGLDRFWKGREEQRFINDFLNI